MHQFLYLLYPLKILSRSFQTHQPIQTKINLFTFWNGSRNVIKQSKLTDRTTELNSISFPNSQEWSSLSSGLISGNARIPCLIQPQFRPEFLLLGSFITAFTPGRISSSRGAGSWNVSYVHVFRNCSFSFLLELCGFSSERRLSFQLPDANIESWLESFHSRRR